MNTGKIKLVAALILAVLAIVWTLQNRGVVQTRFLFATVAMPQSALLALTLLLGAVVGLLLALGLSGHRKKKRAGPSVS